MASFFGEVLPVVSRAVDEEEDDDNSDESCPQIPSAATVRWTGELRQAFEENPSHRVDCDVLIIAVGPAATTFVETYILPHEHELIGNIFTGLNVNNAEETLTQRAPIDKSCAVYRLRGNKKGNVIVCPGTVAPEQAFSWTYVFLSRLDLTKAHVVVLNSDTASNYQSPVPVGDLRTPFVRALKTQCFQGTPFCKYLETPNSVTGLPAQILVHCQLHNIAAVLCVVYADSIFLDASSVKAFMPLAKINPLSGVIVDNPKAEELLASLVEYHQNKIPLYI